MTVVATTRASSRAAEGANDRAFYSGMAIAMAATVLVGFGPTFYFRPFIEPRPTVSGELTLSPLAYVHGAVFTAWVLLFIIQTRLIAGRRTRVHQRVGIAGVVLAVAMVIVGARTAIASAARGSAPPGTDPLGFLAVPMFDLLLFSVFVALAVARRRDRESHKRLMLMAYVAIITAAFARIPGIFPLGPFVFFGLSCIFILAGVAYDLASRRRVHPVYIWGGAAFVLSVPLRLMISSTGAWQSFAQFLTR
jgi:hypothetical protein